ncbi:MAG TPA: MEDS domain-containing protein [Syntrophobacteraceae bacterium]|nr:MEDS domain-containing protein [Syntrophobacteraceae bacterium]
MRQFSSLIRVEDLEPGDHVACLYQTDEERQALVETLLHCGLERREKILYIADGNAPMAVQEWFRKDRAVVQRCMQTGQLSILTDEETFMERGVFDPSRMITLLVGHAKRALRAGYSGLRVMGEMGWASRGFPGSHHLIDYEAKLNESLPESKCLLFCQYDRRLWSSALLLYVLATHPIVAAGANLCKNPYYMAHLPFLGHHHPKTILEWMLINLSKCRHTGEDFQSTVRNLSIFRRRA